MKDYLIFLVLIFIIPGTGYNQEMLGIANSNYSGIYGISINPANMVGSRLYMDYNLLSFQSSAINNYIYVERNEFLDYLFNGIVPVYYTTENEKRGYTIYRENDYYYGYINQRIIGPGAMIVDGKHAYGVTTAMRTNASFKNLPNDIGLFLYEAIDYDAQHEINYIHDKDIRLGSMAWFEINFSYAYNFKRYKWDSWALGVTVKSLLGSMGTYSNIYDVNYNVHNDDSATVYNTNFEYAYSIPLDYNNNDFPGNPFIRGFGLGIDLGITYAKTTKGHSTMHFSRLCEQRYEHYNYKFGISLLDIGFIRFTRNAELKSYHNSRTSWYKPYDTLPDNSVNDITTKLDYYFYDNSEEVKLKNKFNMSPPPALCLQYDHAINKFLFLNGTLIYGFNLGKAFIKRPSIIMFAPRFETARIEFSLPVSFIEWDWGFPRIGLAVRFGNLFAGLDKINSFIGLDDYSGFDLYGGIRLNLSNNLRMNFIKGLCGKKKLRNIETFDFRNF